MIEIINMPELRTALHSVRIWNMNVGKIFRISNE